MSSTTATRDATLMTFVTKPNALYDEIVKSHPSLLRGIVWCGKCGKSRTVDPVACLRRGWPKCCAGTMTIDSPAERGAKP